MRHALTLGLLAGLIGLSALAVVGCGRTVSPAGAPLNLGDTSVQQSNQSGSPTPGTPGASPSQLTRGQVRLTMDKAHYAAGDAITATIANGLTTSIWTADHQTSCSVLTVELRQGDQWQAVAPCRLMIATRMVQIAASSQTPVKLLNASTDPQSAWPAGTYRAKLSYRAGAEYASGADTTLYSALFTIG